MSSDVLSGALPADILAEPTEYRLSIDDTPIEVPVSLGDFLLDSRGRAYYYLV